MQTNITFPVDLIAVIPYILPLLFVGILLLICQRYLPQTDRVRNIMVGLCIMCFLCAVMLTLYAGFGQSLWGPTGPTLGSWPVFIEGIQWVTSSIFGSAVSGVLFIALVTIGFLVLTYYVIPPPNPDFIKLNEELRTAQETADRMKNESQKLESERKKLTEFIAEKEQRLKTLQTEIDQLKQAISESDKVRKTLETQLSEASKARTAGADAEQEYLKTIAEKDNTISRLQAEIERLKKERATITPKAGHEDTQKIASLESRTRELEAQLADIKSRAETATEVADSVISDLAQLMSQIDSSRLDPAAKIALTSLVEGLGRAIGRISRPPADGSQQAAKIELIGAVLMVHEIADGIKRLTRT